jgi:hypothetical protein
MKFKNHDFWWMVMISYIEIVINSREHLEEIDIYAL